jgi:hypothetical protein
VGKTALVCALIASLPEFHWTAVKLTAEEHGISEPVWEETEPGQETDTARYLAAGARRALLATAPQGRIPISQIWESIGPSANVVFESNRIAAYQKPNLCLAVLGAPGIPIKPSFREFMHQSDALVVPAGECPILLDLPPAKPLFQIPVSGPERLSPAMLAFVRLALRS